jgi:hypothetical protein
LVAIPWPTGPERWLTQELSLLAAQIAACVPIWGNTVEMPTSTHIEIVEV